MKKAELKCLIIAFFLLAVFAAGCGSIGTMISPSESYSGEDSLVLPVALHADKNVDVNIINAVAEVGNDMGFSVSERRAGMICLSSSTSLFIGVMVGKSNYSKICITKEGDMLKLEVLVAGNFGTGGQQEAVTILGEFKKRLMKRLMAN